MLHLTEKIIVIAAFEAINLECGSETRCARQQRMSREVRIAFDCIVGDGTLISRAAILGELTACGFDVEGLE